MKTSFAALLLSLPLVGAVGTAATVTADHQSQQVNATALADIPPAYLVVYEDAGHRFGVSWQILAAIGKVESDHGRNPNAYRPNYAGAVGPMQFLPSTFAEYASAAGHAGADILDPHDAIFAAAAMLDHNGAATNLWGAIYSYNHAGWYVDMVLEGARRYGWQG
ncbi:MAG: lytic transglycosylase domain-containing protein [Candidatus Dormibacteria bacterium]